MLIRHNKDGRLYLYDIMNIKKKRESFSSPKTLLSKKTRFLYAYFNENRRRCQAFFESSLLSYILKYHVETETCDDFKWAVYS